MKPASNVSTRQLSVRIDEKDFDRLDQVAAHLGGDMGVGLRRSHAVRRLIHDGISQYWAHVGTPEPVGPVEVEEAEPVKKRKRAGKKG